MLKTVTAILIMSLPGLAAAQVVAGPYVSIGGGVDFQQNEIVKAPLGTAYDFDYVAPYNPSFIPSLGVPQKYAFRFSAGAAAQGSAGYGFSNGFRIELEGDYVNTHVSGVAGAPYPASAGGYEEKFGSLLNVFYDFDLGLPVYPYLGLGIGGQRVDYRTVNAAYIGAPPPIFPVGDVTHLNRFASTGGFA